MQTFVDASSRISELEKRAAGFITAGVCSFFLEEVANTVDVKFLDETLQVFEEGVSSLLSEHSFLVSNPALKKRRMKDGRRTTVQADALRARLEMARKQVWTHVRESWATKAKEQFDLIVNVAADALTGNGQVTYANDQDEEVNDLINIHDLNAALSIQPILDHKVWTIVDDNFGPLCEARDSFLAYVQKGEKAYQLMECALVGATPELGKLHRDLHWSAAQLEAFARCSIVEFGDMSEEASLNMQMIIEAIVPLAKGKVLDWYGSVRVLVEMYARSGPGVLPAQQIACVLSQAPPLIDAETTAQRTLLMFITDFLKARGF